jgi:translation initiation factor 6
MQVNVHGESFIGLLGFATDKYAILSENFPKNDVLDVPVLNTRIYGTNLVGLFCQGNSNGILLPYFVSDEDLRKVGDFARDFGLNVGKVNDKHTALGNLIACNDRGALVSPLIEEDTIGDVLGVEVVKTRIANSNETGSCITATNKGFLAHNDAENQLNEIGNVLKVKGLCGTVNYGFPFVKSGVIANSNGYLAGMRTSGIELGRIEDALGFLF